MGPRLVDGGLQLPLRETPMPCGTEMGIEERTTTGGGKQSSFYSTDMARVAATAVLLALALLAGPAAGQATSTRNIQISGMKLTTTAFYETKKVHPLDDIGARGVRVVFRRLCSVACQSARGRARPVLRLSSCRSTQPLRQRRTCRVLLLDMVQAHGVVPFLTYPIRRLAGYLVRVAPAARELLCGVVLAARRCISGAGEFGHRPGRQE